MFSLGYIFAVIAIAGLLICFGGAWTPDVSIPTWVLFIACFVTPIFKYAYVVMRNKNSDYCRQNRNTFFSCMFNKGKAGEFLICDKMRKFSGT